MHIFILGHSNEADGRLSAASESRIAFAISLLKDFRSKNRPAYLLATGGFGNNFNISETPHHIWVENQIRKYGLSAQLRSGEMLRSSHTVEDAILIKQYCFDNDVQSFLIVTNDFHFARTKLVFDAIFNPASVRVLAAPDPTEIDERHFAHERDSVGRLETQGGVIWADEFYPLMS
ncbi:MAG: YdcF family protein [Pseudomonadota bacterium]